tara:strand:+ start:309 stop:1862 length:1554 start_codon:yes stop_codon:yes gene_type:complete
LANDLKIQDGQPVDGNIRPILVGGKVTALETAQSGDGCKVTGDLELTNNLDIKGEIYVVRTDLIQSDSDLSIDTITLGSGDIYLQPQGHVYVNSGAYITIDIDPSGSAGAGAYMKLMSILNDDDYCMIETTTNGVTEISTVDADAALAHLTLDVDGDINLDSVSDINLVTGGANSVVINSDITDTDAGDYRGLYVDFDKTGSSETNNTITGIRVDATNTEADDGVNNMYGIDSQATLRHSEDAGNAYVHGARFHATGGTNGSGTATALKLKASGSGTNYGIYLNCEDGGRDLRIVSSADTGDFFQIQTSTNGVTTISTVDDDGNDDADLTLDVDGKITLDSATGEFEMHGAGTTAKFADMYAGMLLGYTDIGLDEAHITLDLTTSYVIPTDEFSISFVVPPSGNIQIEFQIQSWNGSNGVGTLYAGLSTTNKTSGYTQLEDFHEKGFWDSGARSSAETVTGSWTLTGLTAGDSDELWIAFKTLSTTGTPKIRWGGDAAGRYPDFIMKATALPASITT